MKNRYETLLKGAEEFSQKARQKSSVQEIILHGSLAKGDPLANDVDLAIIISNFDEFPEIARDRRKLGRIFHSWDVFVFDSKLAYLGRICHWKDCPASSVQCLRTCEIPYLKTDREFTFKENKFYSSPFKILYTAGKESQFLERRKALGTEIDADYEKFEDIQIHCDECGKLFTFSAGEQKYFQKRGFSEPKRCEECRFEGRSHAY